MEEVVEDEEVCSCFIERVWVNCRGVSRCACLEVGGELIDDLDLHPGLELSTR